MFQNKEKSPADSIPIPWSEWDTQAPVSHCVIHFTYQQLTSSYLKGGTEASNSSTSQTSSSSYPLNQKRASTVTRHDVILSHIWAWITHARRLQEDPNIIHYNLSIRTRPILNLPAALIGSPMVVMTNIEIVPSSTISPYSDDISITVAIANRIRTTAPIKAALPPRLALPL